MPIAIATSKGLSLDQRRCTGPVYLHGVHDPYVWFLWLPFLILFSDSLHQLSLSVIKLLVFCFQGKLNDIMLRRLRGNPMAQVVGHGLNTYYTAAHCY